MSYETENIIKENDEFWFNDISILFNKERITDFFPSMYMNENEKLNAILRFSIYFSFIIILYKKNYNLIIIPIIVGLITLYIYRFNTVQTKKEKFDNTDKCFKPTEENPFMNTLLTDTGVYKEKKEACFVDEVVDDIEKKFNKGLFKDVNDLYSKNNSQRQFYTVANTNEYGVKHGDSVKFANWLYNTGENTCKEDTSKCTGTFSKFDRDLSRQKSLLLKN
jgi:hypothetical protein